MIRARDIIESMIQLNERNVINTDDIDNFVARMSSAHHIRDKRIHQWLQTTLRKYLINDYPSVGQATDGFIQSRPEYQAPWVGQALARGEKLYKVYLGGGLPQSIDHVIDYLTQAMDPPEDFPQDLKIRDLTRISVPDALAKSNDWTEWLNRRDVRGNVSAGEKEIVRLGGYTIVQLTNAAALDLEGKLMQHCVGSYADEVRDERVEIYSLRDSGNKPHVTIEIDPRHHSVEQIKGKQNEPPIEKYREPTIEFLNYGLKKGFIKTIDPTDLNDSLECVLHQGKIYHYHDAPDTYYATDELARMYMYKGRPQYEDVKSVLDRGADPNPDVPYWDIPLVSEFHRGDEEMVELLLEYGADPAVLRSAIPGAITTKADKSLFELILKHMKSPDWKNICHSNIAGDILVKTLTTERLDLLKFFLDKGVNPNISDATGYFPLNLAIIGNVKSGDYRSIKILLEAGADPDMKPKDRQRQSASDMVAGHPELSSLIQKYRRK